MEMLTLDEAIEALGKVARQMPSAEQYASDTDDEDMVSRNDVLRICRKTIWNGADNYYSISAAGIEEEVRALPSTMSERKSGKWENYGDRKWFRDDKRSMFIQCSVCGELVLNNDSNSWNYCPNCGARMEEPT